MPTVALRVCAPIVARGVVCMPLRTLSSFPESLIRGVRLVEDWTLSVTDAAPSIYLMSLSRNIKTRRSGEET